MFTKINKIGLSMMIFTSLAIANTNNLKNMIISKVPFLNNHRIKIEKIIDRGSFYQIKAFDISRGQAFPVGIFVTKNLKTIFIGKAYNAKNMKEITIPVNMKKYIKDVAWTYGNGPKKYFVFTDPECPFCRQFEKQWKYLKKKVTFYVYLYPLSFHRDAKNMSLYILSLKKDQRENALQKIAQNNDQSFKKVNTFSDKKKQVLRKKLQKEVAIGNTLGVRGTPTVYNMQGKSVNWDNIAKTVKAKVPVDTRALKYLINKHADLKFGDKGNPVYIFTDLDCPFCQNAYKSGELKKLMKNHTVYIFLYPLQSLHPKSLAKTVFLLSQKTNKAKIKMFDRFMRGSKLTSNEAKIAQSIIKNKRSKILEKVTIVSYIAQRIGVNGTPTIYNKNGIEINANKEN